MEHEFSLRKRSERARWNDYRERPDLQGDGFGERINPVVASAQGKEFLQMEAARRRTCGDFQLGRRGGEVRQRRESRYKSVANAAAESSLEGTCGGREIRGKGLACKVGAPPSIDRYAG